MELWDFIIWGLTETVKNILIFYGMLGYPFRKGYKRWGAVISIVFLIGIVHFNGIDTLYLKTVYGFTVIFLLFEGKIRKKIQAAVLQFLMISGVD